MENKIYPFKFLDAYTPNDKDIFFGRDEETRDLYEMLKQSDILLVYGASGTGKTSLIQCGLSKKLSDYDWLPFYIRRGSNLNVSLLNNLQKLMPDNENSAGDFLDELLENSTSPNPTENEVVKAIRNIYSNWFKPVYLIFDQFEELFVLGTNAEQRQFVQTINDILAAQQNVKLIFSIREEYLGHLYQFEKAVPQLLRKKMRVEAMHFEKVAQIVAGINNYGQSNIAIEKTNIEHFTTQLFEKIKAEKELTVQLPYLQVFLDKLYLNITADKSRQTPAVFTSAALDKLGDIGDVLSEFLEEQVLELSAELRKTYPEAITEKLWEILSAFATLEGTKEPLSMLQLYDLLPQTKKTLIDAVSQAFTDRRILRYNETDELYELAHDALAKRVAEKRSEDEIALLQARQLIKSQSMLKAEARELFTEKQLALIAPFTEKLKLTPDEQKLIADSHTSIELKRTEKIRRQRKIIAIVSIAAVVAIVFAVFGIVMWQKAKLNGDKVQALFLSYKAINILETNPTLALKSNFKAYNIQNEKSENNIFESFYTIIYNSIENNNCFYKELKEHNYPVNKLIFTKDSLHFITADTSGLMILWDINGNIIKAKKVHKSLINDIAIAPDNNTFLSASNDSLAILWSKDMKVLQTYKLSNCVTSCSYSNNNKVICFSTGKEFTNGDNKIIVKSLIDKNFHLENNGHSAKINKAFFSNDDKYIISYSSNSEVCKWNYLENNFKIVQAHNALKNIQKTILSSDSKYILTCSTDSTAKLWDFSNFKLITTLKGHTKYISDAIFIDNNSKIITISGDSTMRLWNLSGYELAKNSKHIGTLVAINTTKGVFITSSSDKTVKVWIKNKKNESFDLISDLKGHKLTVINAIYNYQTNKIISISIDGTVKIWTLFRKFISTNNIVEEEYINGLKLRKEILKTAIFQKDYIAIEFVDSTISLFKIENYKTKFVKSFSGHSLYSSNDKLFFIEKDKLYCYEKNTLKQILKEINSQILFRNEKFILFFNKNKNELLYYNNLKKDRKILKIEDRILDCKYNSKLNQVYISTINNDSKYKTYIYNLNIDFNLLKIIETTEPVFKISFNTENGTTFLNHLENYISIFDAEALVIKKKIKFTNNGTIRDILTDNNQNKIIIFSDKTFHSFDYDMKIYKIKKYENIIASKFFDDNNLLCIVDEEGMIRFLDKNYSLVLEYNSKMQPKELIFNNDNKILLVGKYELRIFSTPQYIVKNQNIFLK